MSEIVLKIENLSKQYRLGLVGTGTLSHDLKRWWCRIRGKEDPFLKIGDDNDRTKLGSDYVWALKNINFEVKKGEVIGIIGKNGAGKSTLLKILSQVTGPSTGQIKVKGRIAALLEVGTGFHPELTGKENIYLNGAILGMTKKEIYSKLDEIIDFSGIAKYIDTPVKRYSSGMMVRLGFAVAAHLEPEILIVDEVLAVGDAEFQEKCIGKMKNVSESGRTVLFVSHNMASIKALCNRGILLKNGKIEKDGTIKDVIESYITINDSNKNTSNIIPRDIKRMGTQDAQLTHFQFTQNNDINNASNQCFYEDDINLMLELKAYKDLNDVLLDFRINSIDGIEIAHCMNKDNVGKPLKLTKGKHKIKVNIKNILQPGNYFLNLGVHFGDGTTIDYIENITDFKVNTFSKQSNKGHSHNWQAGYVRIPSKWELIK